MLATSSRRLPRCLILAPATWGGAGFLPLMPGTWGTLAALPVWWLLARQGPWVYSLGTGLLLALALLVAGPAQELLGRHDHPAIVIDEAVGLMVALAGVAIDWPQAAAGCFLFRVFDVLKPWPIRALSRGTEGLDVVVDDVLAGVMARLTLEVLLLWWRSP
ncbi:MAG: phosphatidylglycerophosphatase A [Deltaproteobacteria bacterium]|nr:phosphatidylglycerophosphatase A [Deltaproteobacteria bacterium]